MKAKLLVVGTLAGALTLFGWETISNAALPWHTATMRTFADSAGAAQAIRTLAPENGLYYDMRGVVAAVSITPDMIDKSTLLGPMMGKQIALNVVVALVLLLGMQRLPRLTTSQYALVFAVAAFAISLSTFVSNWNWWGYPGAWTAVQVVDRTIGFALMGLALGGLLNKWSPRETTDEWGGVKAHGGLPSSQGVGAGTRG
ncbi:MAG: hypothetical protein WD801_03100 [Gemmatimonadaceae bacterium]